MLTSVWQTEVGDGLPRKRSREDFGLECGALPEGRAAEGPSVAATRRDCQGSPPPSRPGTLQLQTLTRMIWSSHVGFPPAIIVLPCASESGQHIRIGDRKKEKLGPRYSVTWRTVSRVAAALFTF